jgi:hypothetical protein
MASVGRLEDQLAALSTTTLPVRQSITPRAPYPVVLGGCE